MAFSLTLKKVVYVFTSLLNQLVKSFLKKQEQEQEQQQKPSRKQSLGKTNN